MTIVEAIKKVLLSHKSGLTYLEIYKHIIDKSLYTFGAKDPKAIVRAKLRQHCYGIEYPSASPTKHFISDGGKGSKAIYQIWNGKESTKSTSKSISVSDVPEAQIIKHHQIHIESMKNQIMDKVYNSEPGFFEKLLIKLLIKMGFGWDGDKAGLHTGGPNDRGVDGIIFEDQLGLERVYIQAKRYKEDNGVSSSDIHQFIGAMNTKNANKGVFITSSYFSKNAMEEARSVRNISLVLINGEKLSELLLNNGLGVNIAETYCTYTIDTDAFSDA